MNILNDHNSSIANIWLFSILQYRDMRQNSKLVEGIYKEHRDSESCSLSVKSPSHDDFGILTYLVSIT